MKNKKIAILTTDLYKGGVAESTRKMVKVVSKSNSVDLIVYDNTPVTIKTTAKREIFLNLPLAVNFAKTKVGRWSKRVFRLPCLLIAVLYLIYYRCRYRPDVIYSMMYVPNIVNVIASKFIKTKTKIIISERQDPRMDLNENSIIAKLLKRVYPAADRIHANSYGMINAISDFYRIDYQKIYHLDNFFDFDEIKAQSTEDIESELKYFFEKKVIITSGRLSRQKGHWHLIDAFNELSKLTDEYRLVILGDGELELDLKHRVEQYNINSKVKFLGNVDNPHKYIARAYVFVFPSIWESFGNSLVEAMALGIPVISTSCKSGPDYIISSKYGIDLKLLNSYELSTGDKYKKGIELIKDEILRLEDSVKYDEYSKLATARSNDFDVVLNKAKIMGMFCDF